MRLLLALGVLLAVSHAAEVKQAILQQIPLGYEQIPGNCRMISYTQSDGSILTCSQICDRDPRCCGFSFVFSDPVRTYCLFREQFCQTQDIGFANSITYLRKRSCGGGVIPPLPPAPPATLPPVIRPPAVNPPGGNNNRGCGTSNEGTEFFIMFMENRADRPDDTVPLELFITPGKDVTRGTDVRVTVEWQHPSQGQEVQTVRTNDVVKVELSRVLKMQGTGIERKAVRVSSSEKVVLYGVNKDVFTADAFLGLPVTAVGQAYYVITYFPPTWNCEFGIAAIMDNTQVTITVTNDIKENKACQLNYNGRTYSNGETFTVPMNRWDAFQAQDTNKCDLTGTHIQSDKPISVFSGNMRAAIADENPRAGIKTRDHLVEQLVPENSWGNEFVTVPIPDRTVGDVWIFVASEDNTQITLTNQNQRTETIRLNKGGNQRKILPPNEYWHIKSNNQISVAQFVHSQITDRSQCGSGPNKNCHDPSMILYTPLQQFLYGYSFSTPSAVATSYVNRLLITIEAGQQNGLLLDNQPLPATTWTSCGASNYVGTSFEIQQGTHTISHRDSRIPFGAYIYGAGNAESYGLPTGVCVEILRCQTSFMNVGDGRDNDCDGRFDEEACGDNFDNDGDGQVDEDCGFFVTTTTPPPPQQCGVAQSVTICMDKQGSLTCPGNQVIKMVEAHFGRVGWDTERSCGENNPFDCKGTEIDCGLHNIMPQVFSRCDGKNRCDVPVTSYFVGNCAEWGPCRECSKYAHLSYMCVDPQQQRCRVMSGLEIRTSPDAYYTSSTHSKSGASNGVCQCSGYTCDRGCKDAKPDPRGQICNPEKAQFSSGAGEAWCPAACDLDRPYLTFDVGGHYRIEGFVVQGRRRWDQWVNRVGFQYSNDGTRWNDVQDGRGQLRGFQANSDARAVNYCYFGSQSFVARYVRVVVLEYRGYPALHIDLMRCSDMQGCPNYNPQNSNYAVTGISGVPGMQVTVKCDDRFMTRNRGLQFQMTCEVGGQWRGQDNCDTVRDCPEIPFVQGALHNGRSTKIGQSVTYTCQNGRQPLGGATITCGPGGQWSAAPQCN